MSSNVTITKRNQEQVIMRADLSASATKKALTAAGLKLPGMRQMSEDKAGQVMWFSPDEALLFVENAQDAVNKIQPKLPKKHLIHDATGARVVFKVEGKYLRDILAKGTPRDMSAVKIGEVVRTHLGQFAVAFWFLDENTIELVCFRSLGEDVARWLEMAAKADGLPVLG